MGQRVRNMHERQVVRPEESVFPEANTPTRALNVQVENAHQPSQAESVLTILARLATNLGIHDLADRHTEYAHGRKLQP